ncbi:MAG: class I tRNA ligase family protein, partial [Treponema sp.]|nr:class I tRNA ligase family protein [Treponema sp.]
PHLGEELWEKLGNAKTVAYEKWPTFSEEFLKDDTKMIVVQVNGKLRDKFEMPANAAENEIKEKALSSENVKKFTEGHEIVKVIVIPGKLVNIVIK